MILCQTTFLIHIELPNSRTTFSIEPWYPQETSLYVQWSFHWKRFQNRFLPQRFCLQKSEFHHSRCLSRIANNTFYPIQLGTYQMKFVLQCCRSCQDPQILSSWPRPYFCEHRFPSQIFRNRFVPLWSSCDQLEKY